MEVPRYPTSSAFSTVDLVLAFDILTVRLPPLLPKGIEKPMLCAAVPLPSDMDIVTSSSRLVRLLKVAVKLCGISFDKPLL